MAADTFTKLFSGIIASTVWQEPDSTRLTWITMLAMADKDGVVAASVPGLAHMARVSLPQCEAALATFLAPDPYSRTPDHDGRRIEACDGGWRLLNHALYRGKRDDEDRRARQREWDRNNRPSGHQRAKAKAAQSDSQSDQSDENRQGPTQAEADTEAEASKAKATVHPAAPSALLDGDADGLGMQGETPMPGAPEPDPEAGAPQERRTPIRGAKKPQTAARFPEWYAAYPVKKGRANAEKAWRKLGCDAMADTLIAHVRRMEREDDTWLRGFIPHPATYLNQERWNDEPTKDKPQGASTAAPPAPETFGAKAALAQSESKLDREIAYIRHQYATGAYGEGETAKAEAKRLLEAAQAKYGDGNGNAT